jgi:hypothetical protein
VVIEQVIADLREEANVLRKTGNTKQAETYDRILAELKKAPELEELVTWLSEEDAMFTSGKGKQWLRSRFCEWEERGHAKKDGRKRWYRMIVLPQRPNIEAAYRAGREDSKAA